MESGDSLRTVFPKFDLGKEVPVVGTPHILYATIDHAGKQLARVMPFGLNLDWSRFNSETVDTVYPRKRWEV